MGRQETLRFKLSSAPPFPSGPLAPPWVALGTACFHCPVHKGRRTRPDLVTQHDHTQELRSGCPLNLDLKCSCSVTLPLLTCECAVTLVPTPASSPQHDPPARPSFYMPDGSSASDSCLCRARAPRCRPFLPLQAGTGTEAAPQAWPQGWGTRATNRRRACSLLA